MRSTLVGKGVNWLCVNRFIIYIGRREVEINGRRERRVIIKMYKRGRKEEYN